MEQQFIETIKLQNNILHNLAYHNARANAARRQVLNIKKPLRLEEHITPDSVEDNKLYKCRVTFGAEVSDVSIEPYRRKKLKRLRLIDGGNVDYQYKYADRSAIDTLFAQRSGCDDILIIKDGLITDTSIANVALFDGFIWYTPATPLLAGTKRQQMLDEGMLREQKIRVRDIPAYSHIVLFNAMIDLDPRSALRIDAIVK